MNPPVTYCMNLDDLTLMADAACELDGYKYLVTDEASAQRIEDMVTRMHDAVERAAGVACGMIYHEEDGRGSLDYNVVKRFFAEKLASDFENIEERKRYTPRKLLHLYKEEVD